MKYIKYFKENKDDYYTKVSLSILAENRDFISMSQQNIEYLKSIFVNLSLTKDFAQVNNSNGTYNIDFIRLHTKLRGTRIGHINELKDEYFIVYLYNDYYTPSKGDDYYLCDQIDGVEELLKDLKII